MDKVSSFERHKTIIRELEMKNKIGVRELALKLKVTPETIRKDLSVLENNNKLRRIHGGAIQYFQLGKEPHLEKRMWNYNNQKQKIGELASTYIKDDDIIALDVGTTTIHIAKSLKNVNNVTLVTHSLVIAEILNYRLENHLFDGQVIVIGGKSNPRQRSTSGSITNHLLAKFHFDKAFISCGGINKEGIYDFDMDGASASSIMIKQANQVFVVADSSKINKNVLFEISSFRSIDYLITDTEIPVEWSKDVTFAQVEWIKVRHAITR